ncbi:MAG: carboxypeptidase-like regulatory domain-containing protein, partial [Verrucomicrobia bacterium]|nr:carboxypeptidase-like regulatory domain-containing protein [Verrucomicrobiota bacterium]
MKSRKPSPLFSAHHRLLAAVCSLATVLTLVFACPSVRAADGGVITGSVSNIATRNTLEGAVVAVPALSITTLTDNSGRYTLSNLPVGTHEIVVNYIGLDAARQRVTVGAGARVTQDFELTTGIYKLESFKVTGEREGNAAMITDKRNATNVKDVIAMDSFGYLPNMSAGEVVMRLPGVAGSPTDEGLAYRFNIRGMDPALNNVTVDGGTLTSLGTNRSFELQSITGAMFEGMELIKGQTPDKGADSLGGTINFKTRSTFSMKEDSRTNYNFSTRWAPPFFEQTPIRSQHRAHPILNLTHQQVFSVFGGERNLGTSVNIFYSENAVGGFETIFDRTSLLNGPAPVWNYQTWDNTNNRKQQSIAFKTDYKWSPTSKFSLNVTENDNFERMRRRIRVTAQTGANSTAVGTSAI